ncbi:MAG: 3-dehydroquinate synthase [Actinomycetia bacterium]|nr:3-dehydroquinate synthase [Actinomycetes bacterium]
MAPFVALTGFMGSGKSSVGAAVAAGLGWRFVDLDEEFVRTRGVGISDFFAAAEEGAFRAAECELLAALLAESDEGGLVVALGGGTLESPQALDLLRRRGGVVLLDVGPDEAWSRVAGSDRPLATDIEDFRKLWTRRRETYYRSADVVVPTQGRDVDSVARDIVEIVQTADPAWGRLWARRLAATERSSLIMGGRGALSVVERQARRVHERGARLLVLTDHNVMQAWGGRLLPLLGQDGSETPMVVEAGETSKSVGSLERCWDWLAAEGARRDDVLVAIGGGVIGDLGGFTAATYQRGIPLWQIPTSLLAQVDSSVGGKTAVNLAAAKNMVGAFYQPDLVVIDPDTLTTLPDREYSNGLGEVVKHALLMSPEAFAFLERQAQGITIRDLDVLAEISRTNVGFKAQVVEEDEREKGRRAVLNLGHTTAHALEVTQGFGTLAHGHAVGLGLLVSLAVSESLLGLDRSVRERTRALLRTFGLPTSTRLRSTGELLQAIAHDKKRTALTRGFVGLRRIGDPVWSIDIPEEVLIEALESIRDERS